MHGVAVGVGLVAAPDAVVLRVFNAPGIAAGPQATVAKPTASPARILRRVYCMAPIPFQKVVCRGMAGGRVRVPAGCSGHLSVTHRGKDGGRERMGLAWVERSSASRRRRGRRFRGDPFSLVLTELLTLRHGRLQPAIKGCEEVL